MASGDRQQTQFGKSDFEELCRAPVEGVHRRESTMQLIKVDLPRTFPELRLFHRGGPCHQVSLELL